MVGSSTRRYRAKVLGHSFSVVLSRGCQGGVFFWGGLWIILRYRTRSIFSNLVDDYVSIVSIILSVAIL